MARHVLSPKLERVRQGLLMCPHKTGQLLFEARFISIYLPSCGKPHTRGEAKGERTLTKNSPSSESMFFFFLWVPMHGRVIFKGADGCKSRAGRGGKGISWASNSSPAKRLSAGLMSSPGAVTEDSWQGSDSSLVRSYVSWGEFVTLHKTTR